jgi:hypothetical protein
MKPSYDDLTPAQKAKLTRLINKLNEQRMSAWAIQWDAYKKKQRELSAISDPIVQQMKKEMFEAIAVHEQAIKDLRAKYDENYWAIITADREKAKPESEEYIKAQDLAQKWFNEQREKKIAEFWKELGYTLEEETKA